MRDIVPRIEEFDAIIVAADLGRDYYEYDQSM